MAKTLQEMGLTQLEITTQVILEPEIKERLDPIELNQKIGKAIAEALGLTGRFQVNPYQWNFKPTELA